MTTAQRFKKIRAKHLASFRNYLRLNGNGGAVYDFLEVNAFELREHISQQWLSGMTWENYGKFWVVDHVVPLKYFDPTNYKEMKLCWNHNNLKPNYYWDNHAKGYCVEVTKKVLDGMPQVPAVLLLKKKIEEVNTMFNPYYNLQNG